jgi:hypothetical protein
MKTRTVYVSAITGRFVSKEYAEQHKDTTIAHTIKLENEPCDS